VPALPAQPALPLACVGTEGGRTSLGALKDVPTLHAAEHVALEQEQPAHQATDERAASDEECEAVANGGADSCASALGVALRLCHHLVCGARGGEAGGECEGDTEQRGDDDDHPDDDELLVHGRISPSSELDSDDDRLDLLEFWMGRRAQHLKGKQLHGFDFDRQKPIDNFIVDFFCNELMLAIEIDGDSHDYKMDYDRSRQKRLESLGVRFLRFQDLDIKTNMEGILVEIENWILQHK